MIISFNLPWQVEIHLPNNQVVDLDYWLAYSDLSCALDHEMVEAKLLETQAAGATAKFETLFDFRMAKSTVPWTREMEGSYWWMMADLLR